MAHISSALRPQIYLGRSVHGVKTQVEERKPDATKNQDLTVWSKSKEKGLKIKSKPDIHSTLKVTGQDKKYFSLF